MNHYNQAEEIHDPTADAVINLQLTITTSLSLRDFFPHERDFEAYLIRDLQGETSKIAEILETEINPDGITAQQILPNLIPDIVIYPDGKHTPGTAEIIIELFMETWDADHTNRSILYALEQNAETLVVIAPEFPQLQIERLEQLSTQIGRRLLIVEARILNTGGNHGLDLRVIRTTKTAASTERRFELMASVQQACRARGDHSLSRVSVQPDGRIELNTKDVRVQLRANRVDAIISLYLSKADESTATQLFNQLLQDRQRIEETIGRPIDWGGNASRDGGLRLNIRIPYLNRVNEMTNSEFQEAVREITNTYLNFKEATNRTIRY